MFPLMQYSSKINKLLLILLLLVTTMLLKQANANNLHHYELNLSGIRVGFDTPTNYSKDFPKPQSLTKNTNIYDVDIYGNLGVASVLQQIYFDFGKGFFFGKVNGTLEATIVLRKTNLQNIDNKKEDQLLKTLEHDFYSEFSKQDLKDYNINIIGDFSMVNISNTKWSHFKYTTNHKKNIVYAVPLSEKHYLEVIFRFIDNSTGENNNWKEQATDYLNNIMNSFSIESSGN